MKARWMRGLGCRSGVAAIEFALVIPVMVLLTVGVLDLSQAMIIWQETYFAAHTIPFSASIISVQPDKTTALTTQQANQMMSAIYAEMPWLTDGIVKGTRSVTLSSITWVAVPGCTPGATTNCYIPNVTWSLGYSGAKADPNSGSWVVETRPCGPVYSQTTPTGTPPTPVPPIPGVDLPLTTLRTLNVQNPDPILVADVHVKFLPYLFHNLFGGYDFWVTAYTSVRSVDPSAPAADTYTKLTPSGTTGSCAPWP